MARTIFVNPRRAPAKRKRRKKKNPSHNAAGTALSAAYQRGKVAGMANPTRRRRRKTTRRRRRNAGIAPFIAQNPLILSNPRRRRRRRNPGMPSMKEFINRGFSAGGGAAIGVASNTFVFNNIENTFFRQGARIAAAVFAAGFFKGDLGAATGGAMMYPAIQETYDMFLGGAMMGATEADLDVLAADLEDVMDELDDEDFDEDEDEDEDEDSLYEW